MIEEDEDRLPEVTWTEENRKLIELARQAVAQWDAGSDGFKGTLWELHGVLEEINQREMRLDV